ncbi:MAG: non-heme iron oxygenase ferredoxin subunit [Caldilineaceae bacterium]
MSTSEFPAGDLEPGGIKLIQLDGVDIAVYNVGGTFYATQDACTHEMGELSDGFLDGDVVTCPVHGAQFNVKTGAVVAEPATTPLKTYRVTLAGGVVRVENTA